jgi:hypothetical protein
VTNVHNVYQAGKQRMHEYSKDIPMGPLDRFAPTPQKSVAPPNEEGFFSDTDDDHEYVENHDNDVDDDDDDEDEFVVADDIIDGVQVSLSQQDTHELPGTNVSVYIFMSKIPHSRMCI